MKHEALRQMVKFLNSIENGHIYSIEQIQPQLSEWDVIRKELEATGAFNEYDGKFAIDASMPVRYLRSVYSEKLEMQVREDSLKREERFHRRWQDAWIALSVILSAIATIISLTK